MLIETALVSPILFFILLSLMEYGALFRDLLGANDAAETGAKYGAIQGPELAVVRDADGDEIGSATADFTSILNTRASLAGVSPNQVERIVIFEAGSASAGTPMEQVPEVCKTSTTSIAGTCNVYLSPQVFIEIQDGNIDYFRCLAASDPACGWNPLNRSDGPGLNDIDYLGVYINMSRPSLAGGIVPVADRIEVASVHRLEPGQIQGGA